MPSWKTHLMFNTLFIIVWIILFFNYGFINDYLLLIFMIFINYFLSTFPDIDSTKSDIRNFFAITLALIVLFYFVFNFFIESLTFFFLGFVILYLLFRFFPTKHRGITHNFWFSVSASFIITIVSFFVFKFSFRVFLVYFLFLLSGYLSHIILDKIS